MKITNNVPFELTLRFRNSFVRWCKFDVAFFVRESSACGCKAINHFLTYGVGLNWILEGQLKKQTDSPANNRRITGFYLCCKWYYYS